MPARGESEETIVLSCMNLLGNTKPITDFLRHIKESTEMATESMTKIFRPENLSGQITWDQGVARPARTLDAVTLDAHVKDPLVADVQNYLSDDTKKFYISRNIPWRRGYLFYGPPGTGKTSMACAMAGQYGLNVYLLSMTQTGINDETLVNLFEALPSRCILLLEDIDSAGIKREDMKKPVGNLLDPDNKNKLTLSTLLNVLDGISAPEGRIVIMTSNNPDSLDKALVRPGRIDRKVLFDYASNEVAYNLFLRIFGDSGRDNVTPMARAFADQIPENMITPAEVQGHLLQNMASAVEALENTSKFVEDLVAEK
ncbi:P-loop containing nucleoside triphosphate hydrolase protein, partial [Teratosphaeria nubilosa]